MISRFTKNFETPFTLFTSNRRRPDNDILIIVYRDNRILYHSRAIDNRCFLIRERSNPVSLALAILPFFKATLSSIRLILGEFGNDKLTWRELTADLLLTSPAASDAVIWELYLRPFNGLVSGTSKYQLPSESALTIPKIFAPS